MKENIKINFSYIIFSIVFICCIFGIFYAKLPQVVNEKAYDVLANVKFKDAPKSKSVTIVKIDNKSIEQIGQWPWSRLIVSQLISEIVSSHPASLGMDIIFSEQDRTSPKHFEDFYKTTLGINADLSSIPKNLWDNDVIFANQIARSNVVTSVIAANIPTASSCKPNLFIKSNGKFDEIIQADYFTCNISLVQEKTKNLGFINASPSLDGLLRKYSIAYRFGDSLVPSLGVAMLKSLDPSITYKKSNSYFGANSLKYLNHTIKTNKNAKVLNYLHSADKFNSISVIDVLRGEYDKSLISGKFIVLGTTAIGLSDFYSAQGGGKVSGLYTHASFIDNVINDRILYTSGFMNFLAYFLAFFLLVVSTFLVSKKYYVKAGLILVCSAITAVIITLALMSYGVYFPIGLFITPFLASYVLILFFLSYILQKEEKEFIKQLENIRSSITSNMMTMVETRDFETGNHIVRTKEYAKTLANYLYKNTPYKSLLDEKKIDNIYEAAPLHDIGKIGISDVILKKPGRLLDEEMEIMKSHPKIGYDIINQTMKNSNFDNSFLEVASNIAYTHHEKWDGNGYPRGLKGDEIPLEGRIVAMADVYDALTSRRCYKGAFGFEESEKIILESKGTHFDPTLVDAFVVLKDKFKSIAEELAD